MIQSRINTIVVFSPAVSDHLARSCHLYLFHCHDSKIPVSVLDDGQFHAMLVAGEFSFILIRARRE